MRRGAIILAVMSRLDRSEYGYSLVQILENNGLTVEPGTLYPLLRRLEKQGLLESSWDTSESRPRKYYRVSTQGKELYKRLLEEWKILSASIDGLTESGKES
jgi:DNA-binding PadR family transcriptional regulator